MLSNLKNFEKLISATIVMTTFIKVSLISFGGENKECTFDILQ